MRSTSKKSSRNLAGVGALFVGAFAIIFILYVCGYMGFQTARLGVTSIGGLGTVLLALATLRSVSQNQETIRELRIEKKRPIAKDMLSAIVKPSIDKLETNLEKMEDERIPWASTNSLRGQDSSILPNSPFIFNDQADPSVDQFTVNEFRRDYPEIDQMSEERRQLANETLELGDELLRTLMTPVSEYIYSKENKNLTEDEADEIIDWLVWEEEQSELHETSLQHIWIEYRNELEWIATEELDGKLVQIRNNDSRYQNLTEKLLMNLKEVEEEIRSKYGISDQKSND